MTKRRKLSGSASSDPESDFRAALKRLVLGTPRHPDLKSSQADGKLKVSISSVAKEAGRARGLIASIECAYPEVRREILAYVAASDDGDPPVRKRWSAQDIIRDLRQTTKMQKLQIAMLATRLQDYANIARAQQVASERAARRSVRGEARKRNPDRVVSNVDAGGNIVPINRSHRDAS